MLCEGKHDCWFLDEVIRQECSIPPLCFHKDLGGFQKCYRSEYHSTQRSFIILSDNGHELMSKYLPKVMDFFGTRRLNLHYIILKDADYAEPSDLLAHYREGMERVLKTKKRGGITIRHEEADYTISMLSESDSRFSFHFHFIFIPMSLEEAIIARSLEMHPSCNRGGTATLSTDPHKALNDIACHLDLDDKEALIRHSVKEQWFSDEDWYRDLLSRIELLDS